MERRNNKLFKVQNEKANLEQYTSSWPQQVPQAHILKCLDAYCQGTIWTDSVVCAVCGQSSENVKEVMVAENIDEPLSFEVLHLTNEFIIRNCIVKCNSAEFTYGNWFLDAVVLDRGGISKCDATKAQLNICPECYPTLKHNKMPRLALPNHLSFIYSFVPSVAVMYLKFVKSHYASQNNW